LNLGTCKTPSMVIPFGSLQVPLPSTGMESPFGMITGYSCLDTSLPSSHSARCVMCSVQPESIIQSSPRFVLLVKLASGCDSFPYLVAAICKSLTMMTFQSESERILFFFFVCFFYGSRTFSDTISNSMFFNVFLNQNKYMEGLNRPLERKTTMVKLIKEGVIKFDHGGKLANKFK
jgi:hypothetical protein